MDATLQNPNLIADTFPEPSFDGSDWGVAADSGLGKCGSGANPCADGRHVDDHRTWPWAVCVPVPEDALTPIIWSVREFYWARPWAWPFNFPASLQAAVLAASYSMALSMNSQIDPTSGDESLSLSAVFVNRALLSFWMVITW